MPRSSRALMLTLTILLGAGFSAFPAHAGTKAEPKPGRESGLPAIMKAAEAGDAAKQYRMATYYWSGRGGVPSKDLALSLAYRHEQDLLVQGNRICYAALCERYGVNPDKEGSDTSLALALAHKYVGSEIGPSRRRPDDWGTKFNTLELTTLVIAVGSVKDHLHRNGERASVRAIAECLQDEKRLARVIPKKAAEAVHAIFLRRGNKSRGMSKPLSDTRLRQLIGEMQTLLIALGARELTPVQMQLYFSVIPLLDGLGWAE